MTVNKIAVYGNAGGGKSTLSKRLTEMTGLPMVALDLLKYKPGGSEVPYEEYRTHLRSSSGGGRVRSISK